MNADSSFIIGATHAVCQDYAIARNTSVRRSPYVILSDGCSTSPETDIGARLLLKAVEQILNEQDEVEPAALHEDAARLALSWAELIGIPVQSVDATLITAYVSSNELLVSCSGDGVIVVESPDGKLEAYAVSYPSGYPFYPTYLHQPDRLAALMSNNRSTKEVKYFHSPSLDEPLRLESTSSGDSVTQVFRFKTSGCKYVAIVSDGIHSFFRTDQTTVSKRVEPILMSAVLKELVSFKSLNGAFVARRVKKFIKDCRAKGWQHADDLSIAVVHLGSPECSTNVPSRG